MEPTGRTIGTATGANSTSTTTIITGGVLLRTSRISRGPFGNFMHMLSLGGRLSSASLTPPGQMDKPERYFRAKHPSAPIIWQNGIRTVELDPDRSSKP